MLRRAAFPAFWRYVASALLTLLIAGFLGATLIRFGPGYETDERAMDARYSDSTAFAISRENARDSNVFQFYGRYLKAAIHGDFGISRSFERPVAELIQSRARVTLQLIAEGLLFGGLAGLVLAGATSFFRWPLLVIGAEALSGFALSLPAAVFALLIFLARGPVFLVLALAIFPRVFRYARELFENARAEPIVEAARTRGIPELLLFWRYIMKSAWPPLLALAGVSFSIAFGALIPVEVVCDIPGIGQLAWKAALSRDLPVLVTLTLLVTGITVAVNGAAEWVSGFRPLPAESR
jgi:peptide/nickel transport system permease protein